MTSPSLPNAPNDEITACAWIASIPDFDTSMVGTTLPPDADPDGTPAPWLQTGYVTVAVAGGSPDPLLPVRRPVLDVQCWATVPGSNRPPWMDAFALAEAIQKACWDRHTQNRTVTPVVNGIDYPVVSVQGARLLTTWRRLYSDEADYACLSADLWLSWIAPGEQIA